MPLFSKTANRKIKYVLSGSWYPWEEVGYKERVKEAEYSGNIMYSCMKMEKWGMLKLFQEWGKGGIKENDAGG
jgi:hypothetical protein